MPTFHLRTCMGSLFLHSYVSQNFFKKRWS